MDSIPPDDIEPFFHFRKDAGLFIQIPVRDEQGRYHMWLRRDNGWWRFQPADLAVSDYFAKAAAGPDDTFSPFVDFLYQRCRNVEALRLLKCITDDMHNLGACFKKLELYHEEGQRGSSETRYFVITEIEYMVSVCRSLYDLQQRIAKELWSNVALKDNSVKKKELPPSFADMALNGDGVRQAQDLQAKYGLGPKLAGFYPGEAEFFRKLRKFRNDIDHGGLTPETIFTTPRGFAVNSDAKPFAQFGVWKEETFMPNKLAPIKPVLAHIVRETFRSMTKFAQAIAGEIQFPEEIAPGYRVFMRGYYIDRLARLTDYIETEPWYPEGGQVIPPKPRPSGGGLNQVELMSLHRHWIWASIIKKRFEQTGAELKSPGPVDPTRFLVGPFGAYMSIWYGMLFGVLEVLKKRGIAIPEIQADMESIFDGLRLYRNAVFHPQEEYFSPKLVAIMKDKDAVKKIYRVHSGIGDWFLAELKRWRTLDGAEIHPVNVPGDV